MDMDDTKSNQNQNQGVGIDMGVNDMICAYAYGTLLWHCHCPLSVYFVM